MRLVLASGNAHKLRELGALLRPHELDPLPAGVELGPETEDTFVGNARLKATRAARATRRLAVADDSGIEAAALGGAPGVRSARFAGPTASDEENLARLLAEVPPDGDRRARYVCALVVAAPDGDAWAFEGTCEGVLADEPRGDGGFGYDPAFLPDDGPPGQTMAQLAPVEKDRISHRGRAARALLGRIERDGPPPWPAGTGADG
jgi:XTP/dITP diphosphohydrolase